MSAGLGNTTRLTYVGFEDIGQTNVDKFRVPSLRIAKRDTVAMELDLPDSHIPRIPLGIYTPYDCSFADHRVAAEIGRRYALSRDWWRLNSVNFSLIPGTTIPLM